MPTLRAVGLALAFAGVACVAQGATPESKALKVGATTVSLDWDAAWQESQSGFQAANPHDMTVLLSAQAKPSPDADVDAYVKAVIGKAIEEFQPIAVEQKLEPRTYSNGGTRGQTVCATDRAPKPEEYKYVCQGITTNGDVALNFMVLYNDAGKAQAEKATRALEASQLK